MLSMPLPQRDTQLHTYADYLQWTEEQRYELIDGIAYLMAPAPSRSHQEVAGQIYRQAANALEGKTCRAYAAAFDVRLPKGGKADSEIDTVVQPDVLIACDRAKLDERGMCGAPDWVAEILSPSTASYDYIIKLGSYERAGVPELWLIHPTDRMLAIYRLEGVRYGRPTVLELKGQTPIAAVPGVSIDWDRLLGNVG
jgi:Uma2 family endonuclease